MVKALLVTSQNDGGRAVHIPMIQLNDAYGELEYPDISGTFDRVSLTFALHGPIKYQLFWKSSIDIQRTLRSGTVIWEGEIIAFKLVQGPNRYCTIRRDDRREGKDVVRR